MFEDNIYSGEALKTKDLIMEMVLGMDEGTIDKLRKYFTDEHITPDKKQIVSFKSGIAESQEAHILFMGLVAIVNGPAGVQSVLDGTVELMKNA